MTKQEALDKHKEMEAKADQFEVDEAKMFAWLRDKHPDWNDHWIHSSAVTIRHILDNNPDKWYLWILNNK